MPNKDLCEKDLLRVPAVFASLVNLLLFDNKNVIQPEQIRYLDFSAHFFFNRRLHPLYHDVGAIVLGSKHNLPFLFCFENQTHSDWLMPVRIFCYMAAVFLWQIRQIRATRKNKDPNFPLERLIPCVIFTLHYGPYVWKPKSFRQLFRYDAYPYLQPFLSDYKINIENIACWDREKIASIHSDFRFVADYCRQMRESGGKTYDPPTEWSMENVEETLMTLAAFSKDGDLKKALYQFIEQFKFYEQKGVVTMSSVIAHIEERGRREGILEAEKQFLAEKKSWNQEKKNLTQERDEMLFTLVILAQKTMIKLGCSAQNACAQLGYSDSICQKVLPFLN